MAEVDIPAAAVKFDSEGGLVRRNSTGNFNAQPARPKILPHYLRASTGSCHDMCKYGFAHVPEEAKAKNPFLERFAAMPDKSQHQARNVTNSIPRKKKSVFCPKVSSDLKVQTPYKCEVIMEEVPKFTKKVSVSSNHAMKLKPVKTKVISVTAPSLLSIRYTELILPKVLGVLQASSNNRRSSESKKVKDNRASKTSSRSAFVAQTLSVSPKTPMKMSSSTKMPSFSAPRKLSRRLSEIIMPKVPMSSSSIRNSEIEMIKKMGTSQMSGKNGLCLSPKSLPKEALTSNSRKVDDPQNVSHVKDQNSANFAEPNAEVFPEKILFVVEPETENSNVVLAENDSLTSHSPPSTEEKNEEQLENLNCNHDVINATSPLSSESKDAPNAEKGTCNAQSLPSTSCSLKCMCRDQIDHGTKTENQIVEQEQRPRRIRRVVSEDRISSLQKVKFGRGKVVNLQSENNSPRKCKFRQGNVLENQNDKADNGGRRLRRLVSDVVSDRTKAGLVKKVVLRHQEVKGRMVSSRSFNHVIEETASKLVESRKSKVKALVGAFETVISLQDRESSEATSTG